MNLWELIVYETPGIVSDVFNISEVFQCHKSACQGLMSSWATFGNKQVLLHMWCFCQLILVQLSTPHTHTQLHTLLWILSEMISSEQVFSSTIELIKHLKITFSKETNTPIITSCDFVLIEGWPCCYGCHDSFLQASLMDKKQDRLNKALLDESWVFHTFLALSWWRLHSGRQTLSQGGTVQYLVCPLPQADIAPKSLVGFGPPKWSTELPGMNRERTTALFSYFCQLWKEQNIPN